MHPCLSDPKIIVQPEQHREAYFEEDHKRWFENPNLALFENNLRRVPKNASLVDVGCGRGDFLRCARKKRPDLRLTGVDLSPNVDDPDIHFIQGDILRIHVSERFDVVVSLAVIEHVAEVKAFVRAMQNLSRPQGTIIVMTLNDGSLLYTSARAGRALGITLAFNRLYSVHHLHHFTRQSFARLLTDGGCKVLEHLDHNAPLQAMDIPVKSALIDWALRVGLLALWAAGRATKRSYLQTIICRVQNASHSQQKFGRDEV